VRPIGPGPTGIHPTGSPAAYGEPPMSRRCVRPGCSEPAVATLRYAYGEAVAWLEALPARREPNDYDLCLRHAARVQVPQGWRLEDRRRPERLAG
jgi:hypothetical protein